MFHSTSGFLPLCGVRDAFASLLTFSLQSTDIFHQPSSVLRLNADSPPTICPCVKLIITPISIAS